MWLRQAERVVACMEAKKAYFEPVFWFLEVENFDQH
jgi:hypothetical protein